MMTGRVRPVTGYVVSIPPSDFGRGDPDSAPHPSHTTEQRWVEVIRFSSRYAKVAGSSPVSATHEVDHAVEQMVETPSCTTYPASQLNTVGSNDSPYRRQTFGTVTLSNAFACGALWISGDRYHIRRTTEYLWRVDEIRLLVGSNPIVRLASHVAQLAGQHA